ncbi:hypothetical protein SUDANB95_05507 [Actinosynnema sp. ALI-1.44]
MQMRPLVGKQAESVRLATARGNIWEGAVRSSKTISSIIKWLRYVRTGPQGPLLMTGKTERTLKRNIIDPITEMVGTRRCRYRSGAGELDLLGRTIYTAGANDERAADKIKGMTLAGAYCDEITTYPESFFDMLGTRLSIPGAQWFGTTNPEGPAHWFKRNYLNRASLHLTRDGQVLRRHDEEALNLHRFSFQLADNPTLDAEYVEDLKRKYVGLFYRRYVLGDWCLAEGAVYDMWDPARHVVPAAQIPRIRHWIGVGVDYGTTNPFSAHTLGLGEDNTLYLVHEYRFDSRRARRSKSPTEYSLDLRAWLANAEQPQTGARGVHPPWIYIDPAAADFSAQLFYDGVSNVANAINDVVPGIRTISSLLAAYRLKVSDACPGVIEEFPGYSWDPKASEKGEDKPIKVDDHGLDDARYVVHSTEPIWQPALRLPVAA